ncbi:MAG: DUF502 domain-containing protein [Gemmatimonadetes bacterium]|nr:DUF502 domain-containing protein [Gemmatimonadota bacterium]
MTRLLKWFVQGLLITVPLVVTGWIFWQLFRRLDSWLGLSVPGAGFVATILMVIAVGFLGTSLLTRTALTGFEGLMGRLPLVRLVYSATKDLLNAFVGEKRRFDKPVLVSMTADGAMRALGFVTQESMEAMGLADSVVVYFPQSYAFAGWTFVVPASRVTPLGADSADVMAFVVSGGVTDIPHLLSRS